MKEFQSRIENIALTLESKIFSIVCWVMIRNALMQHESKGAHFRSDFPNADYTGPAGLIPDILPSPNPFRKLSSLLNVNIILI